LIVWEDIVNNKGRIWLPALAAMTILFAAPAPVLASEEDKMCEKALGAKGFPSKISSVASLNAIQVWADTVQEKYGPDYSMWHNAGKASLKCEKLKKSAFTACFAKGQPCKATTSKTASKDK
jgi:hypothetical protein